MISSKTVLGFVIILCFQSAQSTSTVTGSQVQFTCSLRSTKNGQAIQWAISASPIRIELSFNDVLYNHNQIPAGLRERLNVTGDHSGGEYNLMISDVRKTDERRYQCFLYGGATSDVELHDLIVIVGPTSIVIANKTSGKVTSTEDQDLAIQCTAINGDPAPHLTLKIGTEVYKSNSVHNIEHTINKISRSYDGLTITCEAGYEGVQYTPLTDTALITLYLKPLTPTFNMNPVVTENTKSLVLTCTSTGSRPAPTERMWLLGNSNADITFDSTFPPPSLQSDGTYTVTSTLRYRVNKIYNQQNITCGYKNKATESGYVSGSSRVNVHYAPVVTVQNRTFFLTQTSRNIHCTVESNPAATFTRWQHLSKYGELIREFVGNSTLVLPPQNEEDRYQDTGEYVCTVSNGIPDEDGNLDQRGSGYVISTATPRFLNGASQVELGQFGKDVTIYVSVYSVPKYSTPTWSPRTGRYTTAEVSDVITYTFYDKEVMVDGYRLTLSIQNLVESDFVNYTLMLNNGVGQTVEHIIVLLSASPPETPAFFSVTGETESTVTIHWFPAFDGGHNQWFVVQYRSEGSQAWQDTEIPVVGQVSEHELHTFTLSGLQDGTSYEVRMYAENKFSKSLPTDTKKISTKGAPPITIGMGTFAAVVSVLSAIILISVMLNGYLLLTNKTDNCLHHAGSKQSTTNTEGTAVYVDITSDQEDRSTTEIQSYETLGTVGKPNVYDDLDTETNDSQNKIYLNTSI